MVSNTEHCETDYTDGSDPAASGADAPSADPETVQTANPETALTADLETASAPLPHRPGEVEGGGFGVVEVDAQQPFGTLPVP